MVTNRFTFWASIRETVTKTGGGFHAICCNGLHQGPPARLRQTASTPNFKGSQRMTPLTRKLHPTPPCPAPTADDALRHIPGLDVNAGLRRVLDKRPAYEGLLRKFVAGQAHAVQATRTALAAGQHDEAQRAMHTLKGTAGTIEPLHSLPWRNGRKKPLPRRPHHRGRDGHHTGPRVLPVRQGDRLQPPGEMGRLRLPRGPGGQHHPAVCAADGRGRCV